MATRTVEGNTVGWNNDQSMQTRGFDPAVILIRFNSPSCCMGPIESIVGGGFHVVMPSIGKFNGLVYHCGGNDDDLTSMFEEGRKNGVLISGPMSVEIKPLETGFFFAGPDVPEFHRDFLEFDKTKVGWRIDPAKNILKGTFQATLMCLIEMEFPIPPIPPLPIVS